MGGPLGHVQRYMLDGCPSYHIGVVSSTHAKGAACRGGRALAEEPGSSLTKVVTEPSFALHHSVLFLLGDISGRKRKELVMTDWERDHCHH